MLEVFVVHIKDLVPPLQSLLVSLSVLHDILHKDTEASVVATSEGELQLLLPGRSGDDHSPRSRLGSAGEVEHPQLSLHLGPLQPVLEGVEELHHLRVQLEVCEMIVDPEEKDPGDSVPQVLPLEPLEELSDDLQTAV